MASRRTLASKCPLDTPESRKLLASIKRGLRRVKRDVQALQPAVNLEPEQPITSTMRGTLTRFNQNSGIGRITSEHGIDLQVHKSSIDSCPAALRQGQTVEFRIYYGPNGPIAENVHRLRSWFHIRSSPLLLAHSEVV